MYLYHFMQIKSSQSSNPLQNPRADSIFCFAWIPIIVFDNSEVKRATWSTLRDSIPQTAHYSTQNDFPVPLFITNIFLSMKIHLGGQTHKKTRSIKDIFRLNPTRHIHPFVHRSIDRSRDKIAWWWWPLTKLLWRHKNVFPRCRLVMHLCDVLAKEKQ